MDSRLIGERLSAALNEQIGSEFFASIQYVAVAFHFDSEALPVLAQHFYRQAMEERGHAMKFIKYLVDAGGTLAIPSIAAPQSMFKNAEEAVGLALKSELRVTEQINHLMDIAKEENDHLAQQFLQWFVDEQLEEVSGMEALLKTVRRAGENGLLMVEQYLHRAGSILAAESPDGEE